MSQSNIDLLIQYAEEYNLTAEQKAAMLAVVGNECEWKLKPESPTYRDIDRLMATFSTAFKGNREIAAKYVNWRGDPKEFFNFVYAPANGGARLGNVNLDDGQKYRGRGFIQITGRANYEWAQKTIFNDPMFKGEYDVVANPDLMLIPDIAARVAVVWFCYRIPKTVSPTAHPQYLYAAMDNVNIYYSPAARRRIIKYYEHFYGVLLPESYRIGEKSIIDSFTSFDSLQNDNTYGQTPQLPLGFSKRTHKKNQHRSERSKLASGISVGTIVEIKESKRKMGIEIATPSTERSRSWDQPSIPYGARYPFNHVRETRSGHIQEFDDTPGYERIHTYHKAGTFEEIDANGTKVTRVVGDNYTIVDNNGYIYIAGSANVTVTGDINIVCKSHANINVNGSAEARIGGNLQMNIAGDMDVAVGGTFSLWSNGNMNLQSNANANIRTQGSMFVSAESELNVVAKKNLLLGSTSKNTHILSNGDTGKVLIGAKKQVHIKSDDKVLVGGKQVHVGSSEKTYVSADDEVNIHSTSVNVEGTTDINMNKDAVEPASPPVMAAAGTKALVRGMTVIPRQFPANRYLEPLVGPGLHGEDSFIIETPEEADNNPVIDAMRVKAQMTYGKPDAVKVDSKPIIVGGAGSGQTSFLQSIIISADPNNFTGSYKVSKNFTLDMLVDGGFNRRHKLRDQNGVTRNQIIANLSALAENVLEKCIEVLPEGMSGYGKLWTITSGYRDTYVATAGQSRTSDHHTGRAVDIQLMGLGCRERARGHYDLAVKLDTLVPYDQLLLEYWQQSYGAPNGDTSWIHIGYRGPGTFGPGGGTNRKDGKTILNHSYPDAQTGFVLYS